MAFEPIVGNEAVVGLGQEPGFPFGARLITEVAAFVDSEPGHRSRHGWASVK